MIGTASSFLFLVRDSPNEVKFECLRIDGLLKLRADINSRNKKALPRFSLMPQMSALDPERFKL